MKSKCDVKVEYDTSNAPLSRNFLLAVIFIIAVVALGIGYLAQWLS